MANKKTAAVSGCSYAMIALVAQAMVTLVTTAVGWHLGGVATATVISILVGGGTLALHTAGIVVPGAPADYGLQQLLTAVQDMLALLQMPPDGPPSGGTPVPPSPPPDPSWPGPAGPTTPLGAGHAPPVA